MAKLKKLQINNIAIQFECRKHENKVKATLKLIDFINATLADANVKIVASDMFSPVDIDEI
jgi:hypothetical protein